MAERREKEDHARQERDRLIGLLEASQRMIEDQSQKRRKPYAGRNITGHVGSGPIGPSRKAWCQHPPSGWPRSSMLARRFCKVASRKGDVATDGNEGVQSRSKRQPSPGNRWSTKRGDRYADFSPYLLRYR